MTPACLFHHSYNLFLFPQLFRLHSLGHLVNRPAGQAKGHPDTHQFRADVIFSLALSTYY